VITYIYAVIHRALEQTVKQGLTLGCLADAVDAPKAKNRRQDAYKAPDCEFTRVIQGMDENYPYPGNYD